MSGMLRMLAPSDRLALIQVNPGVWSGPFTRIRKDGENTPRMRPVSSCNKALAFFRGEVFGRPL